MNKAQKVIEFYTLTNVLKNTIRKGWLNWHVKAERVETVAEHVYATQMLALAMYSEYKYDIDIKKVIYMLAIHELEETIIGDLTFKDIDKKEKDAASEIFVRYWDEISVKKNVVNDKLGIYYEKV